MSGRLPSLYSDPALYDLVHAEGTDDEVWLLDWIWKTHGGGPKSALEPACGTGRYMAGLLRRGWTVSGYDLSPGMLAYARKRLKGWGKRATVTRGEMASYRPRGVHGLAFNLLSTFRHLMTDKEALSHLRHTAAALAPEGIMVLGLDLSVYEGEEPDEEVWECRQGGRRARHVLMTLPPDRDRRRERIINFVTVPGRAGEKVLESAYDLRSYDAEELRALIARSPLELEAVYGYDGKPAELGGAERALWLVLKRRPA